MISWSTWEIMEVTNYPWKCGFFRFFGVFLLHMQTHMLTQVCVSFMQQYFKLCKPKLFFGFVSHNLYLLSFSCVKAID